MYTIALVLAWSAFIAYGRRLQLAEELVQGRSDERHAAARSHHAPEGRSRESRSAHHLARLLLQFSGPASGALHGCGRGHAVDNRARSASQLAAMLRPRHADASMQLRDGDTGGVARSDRPVLRFRDAKTGIHVVLVGTMHFNPASINLVQNVLRQENMTQGGLESVCIEMCPQRWNQTTAANWEPPTSWDFGHWLYLDEFKAALEAARECGIREVKLADQEFSESVQRLIDLLKVTASDFLVKGPAGWRAIGQDLRRAFDELASGSDGIPAGSTWSIPVLAGLPVTVVRLISTSWMFMLPILLTTLATDRLIDVVNPELPATPADFLIEIEWPMLLLTGTILAFRIVLVALIVDRNTILARNIRRACEHAAKGSKASVVAIMGMGHVNGVSRWLRDARPDSKLS